MLARFKGILFKAEKIDDMLGYRLYKGKQFAGSIFLDTYRFLVCIDPFDKDGCIHFDIKQDEFQLLDYEIVTKEWLEEIMRVRKMNNRQIAEGVNMSEGQISKWLAKENPQPISEASKASLFNFLN